MVAIDTEPTFAPGTPVLVFEGPRVTRGPIGVREYDVSPNGQQFLMLREGGPEGETGDQSEVILVQNWFEELKERVPIP